MNFPCTVLFQDSLKKGQIYCYLCFSDKGTELWESKLMNPGFQQINKARHSSYPGPLSTTQISAVIMDTIYFLSFLPEFLQLSLWGYNVFSSYYGKPWFILFGLHSYFVWHENKVNYILESFANEILKPIS